MTPMKKELIKQQVDALLDAGIIEECESAWTEPVVLVPDGKVRLCVDYRHPYAITTLDAYPLPCLDDLLHSTGKTLYISMMDLKAEYYQVKVNEKDQDKTAFTSPFGIFRFCRLPIDSGQD